MCIPLSEYFVIYTRPLKKPYIPICIYIYTYIYIGSILIPVTSKKNISYISTPQKLHRGRTLFLVFSFVHKIVLFGAFPRAKNRALDRAFWCSPSCTKSCFLVPSLVPKIVLFGALPRAKNRALHRAVWCSPSCQKSCSPSCIAFLYPDIVL